MSVYPYDTEAMFLIIGVPGSSVAKNLPASAGDTEMQVRSLGQEDLLEEEMSSHSSILAWETP